jgi:hypothetical protein
MLTSYVPRAELTRTSQHLEAREAEHVAELQRLKQRLVVSTWSEAHARATIKQLADEHDATSAAREKLQARASPA